MMYVLKLINTAMLISCKDIVQHIDDACDTLHLHVITSYQAKIVCKLGADKWLDIMHVV